MIPPDPDPLAARLELRHVSKRVVDVWACDRVDLTLRRGEIHALLGDHGAGKSTLGKIVCGLAKPDGGVAIWEGRRCQFFGPREARRLGIGAVLRPFALVEALTVAENLALAAGWRESLAALVARGCAVADAYSLVVQPNRPVHCLSSAERQQVEIVRWLMGSPKLLVLDEPTSGLTPQEAERLFALLLRLRSEGCTCLYITHRLAEVVAICDRATVLRGGRVVGLYEPWRVASEHLAELMVGRIPEVIDRPRADRSSDPPRLQVRDLSTDDGRPFAVSLQKIGFEVAAGEILGIAGLEGNGQAELIAALGGALPPAIAVGIAADAVQIDGTPAGQLDAGARRSLGLAVIPAERFGCGVVATLSLAGNALLTAPRAAVASVVPGFLNLRALRRRTEQILKDAQVAAPGTGVPAGSLSGSDRQRFIVGREVVRTPRVMIVASPTASIDAAAAAAVEQALIDLAAGGAAVVVLSQDLDELFSLCDRIAVIRLGRLSRARPCSGWTPTQVGTLMTAGPEQVVAVDRRVGTGHA